VSQNLKFPRSFFFFIFGLSGFSGLIFESIWSHYLKLFLGHAAFAQTLVLATFMGGMAVGSWVCSRYSARWKNLFLGYALTEGAIGIFGLIFHDAFNRMIEISFTQIIPMLGSVAMVNLFKWSLSAFLILPQSILLGMTFPLMSAGMIRRFPDHPGRSLAMLYFTNSLGAAIGVLTSGFVLIGWVGLPGTIRTAGLINIFLALIVWFLAKDHQPQSGFNREADSAPEIVRIDSWYRVLLGISMITGAAAFMYEVGWIRMLSLVLGSSTHAFELMLGAFLFGLAFGGLWIRYRIDHVNNQISFLGFVQLIMGLLALSTLLLYGNTFVLMRWVLNSVPKTDFGYAIFNLSSHLIALSIMLPATFFSGATLPLITDALIKQGLGEKSIGAVYSANTVGAILGVFFAIHLAMPLIGLKGLISVGAGLNITLGLALTWAASSSQSRQALAVCSAVGIGALTVTLHWVVLDPYKMASGVYREGFFLNPNAVKILYHQDGKTATIDIVKDADGLASIRTNGKVDSNVNTSRKGSGTQDEANNIMVAAVPMALYPQAKTAAVIGFGSGLTTHTLLATPLLERVDTIEIEPAVIEAAKKFRPRVELAYTDPRSRIHIGDAKTYFSTRNSKYDIIISEPSDPWVSGISSLFSKEFYHRIKSNLNSGGMLVQWLQVYEIDVQLVASVLKALSPNFSDYVIYASDNADIVIIARNGGSIAGPVDNVLSMPRLAEELQRIDIRNLQDFELRKVGNKKVLDPLFATFHIAPNSDYFPVLDLKAVRTRFLKINAHDLVALAYSPIPALEMLGIPSRHWKRTDIATTPHLFRAQYAYTAMGLRDFFINGNFGERDADIPIPVKQNAILVQTFFRECGSLQRDFPMDNLYEVANATNPYLTPEELDALWGSFESGKCYSRLPAKYKDWISLFKAVGERDAKLMVRLAEKLLKSDETVHANHGRLGYLLATGMLGHLAQEQWEDSRRLWSQYAPELLGTSEPNLVLRLLFAHSIAPEIKQSQASTP
jgi:spermidine synthase